MPSFKWQSPLHPPCRRCEIVKENDIKTTNESFLEHDHTITTPLSGLYGLIFGVTQPNAPFEESHIFNYDERNKTEKIALPSTPAQRREVLAEHCGCIFRAICNSGENDNDSMPVESSYTYSSATLPLSSEPGNSDVSGTYGVTKVLTSAMIGRIIHLPARTTVRVECVSFCGKGKGVSSCIRNKGWEWGLILHMRTDLRGSDDHVDTAYGSKDRTQIQEPSSAQQEDRNSKQNVSRSLVQKVDFDPPQARKKPILCTTCGRKFPTAASVRHHVTSAHSLSLSKSSNLVAPKIYHEPLTVLYENDELVVVVKPQGMPVQGDKWTLSKSDLLLPFQAAQTREGALSKPRVVHRLDSATGGCLVVAKTARAESELKSSFADRSCKKRYRAILFGRLKPNHLVPSGDVKDGDNVDKHLLGSGTINSSIDKKVAITDYTVISYTASLHPRAAGWITTVDLYPVTGRRHQLRKHMKLVGNPIWGDKRYGPNDKASDMHELAFQNRITYKANDDYESLSSPDKDDAGESSRINMCLWALEISFPRPCNKSNDDTITVQMDEPSWFSKLRDDQEQLADSMHIIGEVNEDHVSSVEPGVTDGSSIEAQESLRRFSFSSMKTDEIMFQSRSESRLSKRGSCSNLGDDLPYPTGRSAYPTGRSAILTTDEILSIQSGDSGIFSLDKFEIAEWEREVIEFKKEAIEFKKKAIEWEKEIEMESK